MRWRQQALNLLQANDTSSVFISVGKFTTLFSRVLAVKYPNHVVLKSVGSTFNLEKKIDKSIYNELYHLFMNDIKTINSTVLCVPRLPKITIFITRSLPIHSIRTL